MSRKPLRRKDAFFGLHFDLHAGETDTSLGADLTEENIAELLERVRPDFVQYDCKGHPGYAGYPTKVGWASPGIVKDALAVWRKVTREHGVGLFIYYSGVYDALAVQQHPEWARVDENGEPDAQMTSTFGPYVDELMIPQLKEAVGAYDLDGLWVDGDCWGARLDYSEAALESWHEESGYQDAPKDPSDPRWQEWKMFHRRQFEEYLCHWVDALHEFKPELDIASNWMYSSRSPKPVAAAVDYLSGDYSPAAGCDSARLEARYLASTGVPWDLMAWGFNRFETAGWSHKPAIHLQQEAAVVLMQGGAFQFYYQPTRSGRVPEFMIETAEQVGDFCRARQAVSFKSTSVPQVALLHSSGAFWEQSDALYRASHPLDELNGALHALLELHYSVDVLAEHQLSPRLGEFPLVVIPDAPKLEQGFEGELLDYVRQGGSLLLMGERCTRLFEGELGVRFEGEPEQVTACVQSSAGIAEAGGLWQPVSPLAAGTVSLRYPSFDTRSEAQVAATVTRLGEGSIGAVYGPVALAHFRTHRPALRQFIGEIVERIFPEPAVRVEAPSCVDIALRRTRDGELSLHLLNLAQTQRAPTFLSTDFVPPLGPIRLKMSVPQQPAMVHLVPEGDEFDWSWDDGTLAVTIPHLHIHTVVIVEQ